MSNNNIKISHKQGVKTKAKAKAKAVPKKEGTKTKAKAKAKAVPKKEGTKTKAKAVPKKEGTKTKAKEVPKKEGVKTKAKAVPKKEGTKTKAKAVPKKEGVKTKAKKTYQGGAGKNQEKNRLEEFFNHIYNINDFELGEITENLGYTVNDKHNLNDEHNLNDKPNLNDEPNLNDKHNLNDEPNLNDKHNLITIIITAHGGECKRDLQNSPLTILDNPGGIKFTTWTDIGTKDQIKMGATRSVMAYSELEKDNPKNIQQVVLENYFKIFRNYITIDNQIFKDVKTIFKEIDEIYEQNKVVLKISNKKENNFQTFLQHVLELSHDEHNWPNIKENEILIPNINLTPDAKNDYHTCIHISYVDTDNYIKIITITLFDLFRFIIYDFAKKRQDTKKRQGTNKSSIQFPPIKNIDCSSEKESKHLINLKKKGLAIYNIFKYIKKILPAFVGPLENKTFDIHLHSCLNNINEVFLKHHMGPFNKFIPKPKPPIMPRLNMLTKDKVGRKNNSDQKEEQKKSIEDLIRNIATIMVTIRQFKIIKNIAKGEKQCTLAPGRRGLKRGIGQNFDKNPEPKRRSGLVAKARTKFNFRRQPSDYINKSRARVPTHQDDTPPQKSEIDNIFEKLEKENSQNNEKIIKDKLYTLSNNK